MSASRPEIILEGDGYEIVRNGNGRRRTLSLSTTAWDAKKHAPLARNHRITGLDLNEISFGRRKSANFLLELPPLRELHISLIEPKDLSAVASHTMLEYLALAGGTALHDGTGDAQAKPVDFSALTRLREVYIELSPVTESLLRCTSLQKVWVGNREYRKSAEVDVSALANLRELHVTVFPKLRDLDLLHNPKLRTLHVEVVPKLRRLTLHPKANLRSLKIGGTGGYRIEWPRIGRDLEELELVGPLKFPMTDVLKARKLRVLRTNGIRAFPPLKFLLKLPRLREFAEMATSVNGPNWSKEDWAVYHRINER